jgi:hypothetical protein
MIGEMILAASGPLHEDRATGPVQRDCQIVQVETRRILAELAAERRDVA